MEAPPPALAELRAAIAAIAAMEAKPEAERNHYDRQALAMARQELAALLAAEGGRP